MPEWFGLPRDLLLLFLKEEVAVDRHDAESIQFLVVNHDGEVGLTKVLGLGDLLGARCFVQDLFSTEDVGVLANKLVRSSLLTIWIGLFIQKSHLLFLRHLNCCFLLLEQRVDVCVTCLLSLVLSADHLVHILVLLTHQCLLNLVRLPCLLFLYFNLDSFGKLRLFIRRLVK